MEPVDYALKLKTWSRNGFKELGDKTGMGMGSTTRKVLQRKRKAMKEMKTMSVSSCLMLPMGQRFQASDNKQTLF